jgi:hypothetical protein
MPTSRNTDSPEEVARQQLAVAVETLSNIFYLIEQTVNDPKSIRELLKMAEQPMEMLRNLASRRPVVEEDEEAPPERRRLPPDEPASETNPIPLAAAGNEADPETRVDRLEAD